MGREQDVLTKKSVPFALKLIRASWRHMRTYAHDNGPWSDMNMGHPVQGDQRSGYRRMVFSILIHPKTKINVNCTVHHQDGEWTSGDLEIESQGLRRKFRCELDMDGKIVAQPIT